ncbi:hypothetical protein D3C87_1974360 [compost metagenome]
MEYLQRQVNKTGDQHNRSDPVRELGKRIDLNEADDIALQLPAQIVEPGDMGFLQPVALNILNPVKMVADPGHEALRQLRRFLADASRLADEFPGE